VPLCLGRFMFRRLRDRTFKSLEGATLVFKTDVWPFKRCLAFQANLAIKEATAQGRIGQDWMIGKNFQTGIPATTRMQVHLWLGESFLNRD
jgi:hypothetical protein